MYTVTLDNYLLHDPEIQEYQIYGGKINLEVNKSGNFQFTIYTSNPNYGNIQRLKSIIEVYDGGELIFRGRPLNDTTGMQKQVTIFCEGELAYLNDSVLDPYDFSGSITQYLQNAIDSHNSQVESKKQFQLGVVTVTDPNNYIVRSNIAHVSTWEEIKAKLIDNLGGYLRVRRVGKVNYLDYLSDSTQLTNQTIELTKNILSYQQEVKAQDIVTVMIPLGAKLLDEDGNETDERLTIESVNSGKKYIEHTAGIAKYGRIYGFRVFDGITTPTALKSRGETTLNNLVNLGISIQIKALDMKFATDEQRIGFFDYVRIVSKPHNIDEDFLVKKQTIDLDYPENNIIEVGIESSSFTIKQLQVDNVIKQIKSDYATNTKLQGISESLYREMSEIIQESNRISLEVSQVKETTYTKSEVDTRIEDVQNEITRVENETTSKIEANSKSIILEKSEREEQYGTISDIISEQGTSIVLLDNQINTTIENRLEDAEGTLKNINETISTVESTQQTFTTRIEDLEGKVTEQQTFFRKNDDGAFIGGTNWATILHADGEKISFINQTGSVQAHFGANGMYTNRWELDFHTIEKFEEGTIKGTIFKNKRSGS